ncbi:MAG: hypothetical protein QHJ82_02620 [Verrucomicrobiota bacterium]|nr:hypothetical protein [Verrucomicrobiota bacterium]
MRAAPGLRWIAAGLVVGLFGILGWVVINRPAPMKVDEERSRLRRQYFEEMQSSNRIALTTYGWIDSRRGIVRLPLDKAMEMSIPLWRDPASARSNLLERLEKATVKLPPKPNIYE